MNNREILGVSSNAGKAEIKQAFRQAAKEYHPDLSDSPEAAEAFAKIKEAHDALIKEAEQPRESVTAQQTAARASAATSAAAFGHSQQQTLTDEELAHIQELDELARQQPKRKFFKKTHESDEIKKHRKKLKTNERRLRGLY